MTRGWPPQNGAGCAQEPCKHRSHTACRVFATVQDISYSLQGKSAIITTGSKEQPTATEQGTAHKAHTHREHSMSNHQPPSTAYEGTHSAQAYSELCNLLFSIWARTVKSRPNYARTARGLLSNTHALYAAQQACPTEYADSVRAVITRLQPSKHRAPQGATSV